MKNKKRLFWILTTILILISIAFILFSNIFNLASKIIVSILIIAGIIRWMYDLYMT